MSFVVAIDGPAAAGKSTTARAVAAALGFMYVDTGALYRAFALKVRERGVRPDDDAGLEELGRQTELTLSGSPDDVHVWLDGTEVSDQIRTPEVSELASRLAARPVVRRRLVETQRGLARLGPLVAEGRDLGTVVFPDADVKLFVHADVETRAKRRWRELERRGIPVPFDEVREEIARRDERDRSRIDSPLAAPADAIVLDTSPMTSEQQIDEVLRIVRSHPRFPDRQATAEPPGHRPS
jgi:cytidylate kinase